MDARESTTYRDSARPKPRVFALRASGVAGRAYFTTVLSLLLTVAFYVLSDGRGLVILCAPLVGAALAGLFAYGPRAIEVDLDGVVVHRHHGPAQRIAASDLRVHVLPGELVLLGPTTSIEIGADRFAERSALATCADALREIARASAAAPDGP